MQEDEGGIQKTAGNRHRQSTLETALERVQRKFEDMAVPMETLPFSIENFETLFGQNKTVDTPLGQVKIGENQFAKLQQKDRESLLWAMKQALSDPIVIIIEKRENEPMPANLFLKSFIRESNSPFFVIMSVVVSIEGVMVSVSTYQRKIREAFIKLQNPADIVYEKTPPTGLGPCGSSVNSPSSPRYSQENDTAQKDYRVNNAQSQAAIKKKSVLILGGGPNRIGQGIEFDYCCCHAAYTVKRLGYRAIMMNCNPETVSTDYDTSDVLYFEPLTLEDVLGVIAHEKPIGVVLQFGGQTPLNLANALASEGVQILGTDVAAIALAEDRRQFGEMLHELQIRQTAGATAVELEEALNAAEKIGYPVLMRPSFVLGGAKMEIIFDSEDLKAYWNALLEYSRQADLTIDAGRPILIDRFLEDAIEIDVDAVADGETVIVAAIMEHIEEAGIHSGDSACSLPPQSLTPKLIRQIEDATRKIALKMKVCGLLNIQFAIKDSRIYVLEVNPRASRTIPFVSKAIGEPMASIAMRVMLGERLTEMFAGKPFRRWSDMNHIAVKESVFPWTRFPGTDTRLGPEMKSTGEVMGLAETFGEAFAKSEAGTGVPIPLSGNVFVSIKPSDRPFIGEIAKQLMRLGFNIIASRGTGAVLESMGFKVEMVSKIIEGERPNILDRIIDGKVQWIINTPSGKNPHRDEVQIRATANRYGIPLVTTIRGAKAFLEAIQFMQDNPAVNVKALQDYV
ncbi:MAG: carbamoyl-phosphate synthase large subunit [Planctomycetaceae bacterium]|nr:carbamoyl-phosphate synthase large subunit [Planctomycetaceae bacterium]